MKISKKVQRYIIISEMSDIKKLDNKYNVKRIVQLAQSNLGLSILSDNQQTIKVYKKLFFL